MSDTKIAAAVKALKACIAAFDTLARYQIHVEPHHPESPKNQAKDALALLEAAQEEEEEGEIERLRTELHRLRLADESESRLIVTNADLRRELDKWHAALCEKQNCHAATRSKLITADVSFLKTVARAEQAEKQCDEAVRLLSQYAGGAHNKACATRKNAIDACNCGCDFLATLKGSGEG